MQGSWGAKFWQPAGGRAEVRPPERIRDFAHGATNLDVSRTGASGELESCGLQSGALPCVLQEYR